MAKTQSELQDELIEGLQQIQNDFTGLKASTIHALEFWKDKAEILDEKLKILAEENTSLRRTISVLGTELEQFKIRAANLINSKKEYL